MFRKKRSAVPTVKCQFCGVENQAGVLEEQLFICPGCAHYLQMPSPMRIATLADKGTFREFDRNLVSVDPLKFYDRESYRDRLKDAQHETGVREAVTTGECRISGRRAALIVFDFGFLGGTMGSTVGEKIARAFEHAVKEKIPVVSVAASGGARVQEGMLSLMQMAKVAAAAALHDRKGLAFISIFTHPTFGGVTASFASLGDVLIAEPGAQIGFVGPRVIEQTTGVPPPEGSHRAETLLHNGLIDMVVPRQDLRDTVAYLLAHLRSEEKKRVNGERPPSVRRDGKLPASQEVLLARHAGRLTARQCIAQMTTNFVELHGDREGGEDPAIVGGLAELDGRTVVMIGQDRGSTPSEQESSHRGMAYPEGYRKALRLMQLAAKFRIPVITLVDCPGAQAGYDSEQRGIAHALASNLAAMSRLPIPIVSVIIGEGGSGGALALAVADRVLMLEHAIYSVISPEGAAAILYRDAKKADVLAGVLKLTARDLRSLGVIDTVVPEPAGGAHMDPASASAAIKAHVLAALHSISRDSVRSLLARRYKKYRHVGKVGVHWREVVRGEILDGLDALARRFPRAAES